VVESDAGAYTVRVSNLTGERWSVPAVLTVNVPLAISTQPSDATVAVGRAAEFKIEFRGNPPTQVRWQRNGQDISGATNATFSIPSVTVSAAGVYTARVSDRDTNMVSRAALLTVVEPPLLVQEPFDVSGVAGRDTAALRVLVDGSEPLRFQWFFNGAPFAPGTTTNLALGILHSRAAGSYQLVVTNFAGAVTSRVAQVSVVLPPTITNATGDLKVYSGGSATFAVDAGGSGALDFRWFREGKLILGETNASLSLTNLDLGNGGSFSVVVSSPYGAATNQFKLEIFPPPVPVVSTGHDVAQVLTLQPGWNAIFLNVQPASNRVEEVFAGLPFASIWRWADSGTGPQFIQEQSEASLGSPQWLVHLPTNRVESFQNNLARVFRHTAYLVNLATNQPVTFTVVGVPGYQRQKWAVDAYTLGGFPIEPGTNGPQVGDYFRPSAAHLDSVTGRPRGIYRLLNDGRWVALEATNKLAYGEAYWVYTKGASSYLAPIEAEFSGGSSLTYGVSSQAKEISLRYHDPGDLTRGQASASFSHLMSNQALPLQINEFDPRAGTQWRDLPNGYSVSYQGLTVRSLRLAAKRERIPDLTYRGIMTIGSGGVLHQIPDTVERDDAKAAPQAQTLFNPVGLWIGSVNVTHVSEVNGVTTNYVVTRITNVVNGVTNILQQPTTNVANVAVGSAPTPVKSPFGLRLLLHTDTNGISRLLQQVTVLSTEATNQVSGPGLTNLAGAEPVLISDPALLTRFRGVALSGRDMVGRRFSTPFYPMHNTHGVAFNAVLGLGRTLSATWVLPATAPLNPFYHKYHPDHDNLDASFKVFKEEAYPVTRTVQLQVPARQGSNSRPGMGQEEVEGVYLETLTGLHKTPIMVQGTFHLKRILPVGVLNPTPAN
jgi:hypothetical protein